MALLVDISTISLPAFKMFLAGLKLKPGTIHSYSACFKLLVPHLNNIDEFMLGLQEAGRANGYLINLACTLRHLGKFLNIEKFKKYPILPKNNSSIRATMSDEEIEKFLKLKRPHHGDKRTYLKYSMFWLCVAYTGARPGEIAHLKINEVDFGQGIFIILDTKINKPRIIPIPPIIKSRLMNYVRDLEVEMLFAGRNKPQYPIGDVDWGCDFHKRIGRLKIKRANLCPYSLRHSFATRLVASDINIFKVKDLLGHSQINQTLTYYHSNQEVLKNTIKHDPLALKKEGKICCPFCLGRGFVVKPN